MGLNQVQAEGLLHSASLHLHLARLEVAAAVAAARDAGMSWEAVARVLGEPRTTVQSRYSDALASAAVDLLAEVTYQDEGKHP